MELQGIIDHALISIVGWILGASLGWITSLGLLALWRKTGLDTRKPSPLLLFVPWRTFILGLFLINYFPIFIIFQFGLGTLTGIFSVAHVVFWLTLIILLQSTQKEPISSVLRFWPWARTLAVFSVALTTHYGLWGGGGLGFVAREQLMIMEFDAAWSYFWQMVGIGLLIDVVFAIGQMSAQHYITPKNVE